MTIRSTDLIRTWSSPSINCRTKLEALPGVTSTAVASPMPLGPENDGFEFRVSGYQPKPNETMYAGLTCASGGYFRTVGTRIVAGRELRDSDDENAPRVVVINETFARRYWRTPEKALSQRLAFGDRTDWVRVVGVARDGKYGTFGEAPQPYAFFPIGQEYRGRTSVIVRTDRPVEAMLPEVRRVTRALDPELAVLGMKTVEQYLERLLSIYQMGAVLLGMFAGCALLLSAVGLFGLLHFNVTPRRMSVPGRSAVRAAVRGEMQSHREDRAAVAGAARASGDCRTTTGAPSTTASPRAAASISSGRRSSGGDWWR